MKSVLISIQPKWVEKIAKGEKTIEVRKTKPNLERPFKCYIYCTKGKNANDDIYLFDRLIYHKYDMSIDNYMYCSKNRLDLNCKVIGEFICDKIDEYNSNERGWYIYPQEETCLLCDEIASYGKGKTLYGWHITDLKIYNKPKELSEFRVCLKNPLHEDCNNCCFSGTDCIGCGVYKPLTRPPQSWCYVEDLCSAI